MNRALGSAIAATAVLMAAGAAAASEDGLVLVPDLLRITLLVIGFALLVPLVDRFVFRPVFRVLDEREARIEGTRRRAEKLEGEAAQLLERYQGEIRRAREESEAERREHLEEARSAQAARAAEARSEAESEIAHARREVASALEDARGALRAQSRDLARQIAGRILGRELA